jgi:uncharacterized membrane protein
MSELTGIHSKSSEIFNVRAAIMRDEGRLVAAIDRIGRHLGRPMLFFVLLAAVLLWAALNLRVFPGVAPWDPYPYMLLATIASAAAPFLTLLVLMYQRRNSRISELREEFDLQVVLHLERQMSMALRLLREAHEHASVPIRQDRELLDSLEAELDALQLMTNVRRELERTPQ